MGTVTFTRNLGLLATTPPLGETADDTYKNFRVVRGTITLSSSYATGGDTIPYSSIGLKEIYGLLIDTRRGLNWNGLSVALSGSGVQPTAQKLLCYDAEATEVANATNLSTRTVIPVWFLGV